jgi:hypothetical protein
VPTGRQPATNLGTSDRQDGHTLAWRTLLTRFRLGESWMREVINEGHSG